MEGQLTVNKAAQWETTNRTILSNFVRSSTTAGFGPQAMSYVDGFLNMTLGAAPANAGDLALWDT